MTNFKIFESGKISEIAARENGKVFLHDALKLSGAEISINCVKEGFKVPFSHKHKQNEEIYIFFKGTGILTIDDAKINVEEGTSVKISPEASRTLENTGKEELVFVCVQVKENSIEQFDLADAEIC